MHEAGVTMHDRVNEGEEIIACCSLLLRHYKRIQQGQCERDKGDQW